MYNNLSNIKVGISNMKHVGYCEFAINDESQGSVATHLKCGKMFSNDYCKFTTKSAGERVLKISKHSAKLQSKVSQ